MKEMNRETLLKIAVAVVVGLFLLDRMVLTPAAEHWKEQGERIESLRDKVTRGRQLKEREQSIRSHWAEMLKTDLPDEVSAAENDVYKGVARWTRESRIALTSLTPQWRSHEEGYDTFECRASATGDQASLGRLLYELESDPLPARLEECELSTRDKTGKQLTLALRFSFIRLSEAAAKAR